jgi:hypothetical protein
MTGSLSGTFAAVQEAALEAKHRQAMQRPTRTRSTDRVRNPAVATMQAPMPADDVPMVGAIVSTTQI